MQKTCNGFTDLNTRLLAIELVRGHENQVKEKQGINFFAVVNDVWKTVLQELLKT